MAFSRPFGQRALLVSRLYRALHRWSDCQVSRTAFGAGHRRLANFGFFAAYLFASTAGYAA
jgi:hypothetical protein